MKHLLCEVVEIGLAVAIAILLAFIIFKMAGSPPLPTTTGIRSPITITGVF